MSYLNAWPNAWGCHDPQCNDSTWDHECPVTPCDQECCADLRQAWPLPAEPRREITGGAHE